MYGNYEEVCDYNTVENFAIDWTYPQNVPQERKDAYFKGAEFKKAQLYSGGGNPTDLCSAAYPVGDLRDDCFQGANEYDTNR